jgi:hypothetical protein
MWFVECQPASRLAYFSTLKTVVTCSSETSVDFQRTTRRYISEDSTIHNHRCENLKILLSDWYCLKAIRVL